LASAEGVTDSTWAEIFKDSPEKLEDIKANFLQSIGEILAGGTEAD